MATGLALHQVAPRQTSIALDLSLNLQAAASRIIAKVPTSIMSMLIQGSVASGSHFWKIRSRLPSRRIPARA